MKKVIALVLAVVMALGMASVALAATVATPGKTYEIGLSLGTKKDSTDKLKVGDLRVKTDLDDGKNLVKITLGTNDDGDPVLKVAVAKDFATSLKAISGTIKVTDKYGKAVGNDEGFYGFGTLKAGLEATGNLNELKFADDSKIGWEAAADITDGTSITLKDVDADGWSATDTVVYNFKGDDKYDVDFDVPNADVQFSVPIYKQGKVNMAYSGAADKKLVVANPDADITFVNFLAAPSFDYNGELKFFGDKIDAEKKEGTYVYGYNNGTVTDLNLTWSEDDGAYILKTNKLGAYVISDKPLKSAPATTDGDKTNPGMGANDMVNVAVVAAVVSLAAAGAVAFKKASK